MQKQFMTTKDPKDTELRELPEGSTPDPRRLKAHQALDAYLDAGGPYEFWIVSKDDYGRNVLNDLSRHS